MAKHIISIEKESCIGCGACVKDCVAHNIELKEGKASIISKNCIRCGHCVAVCPKNSVTISGFKDEPKPIEKRVKVDADDVLEMITTRRSIRQFKDKEIDKEIIEKILEAGRLTHTGGNSQGISYVVLHDKKAEAEKIAVEFFRKAKKLGEPFSETLRRNKIPDNFFFFGAPIAIAIVGSSKVDCGLAGANMEFVAEANGLGCLFSGFFSGVVNLVPSLQKMLEIPKGKKVITTLVIGYPDVKYYRTAPREKLEVKYI